MRAPQAVRRALWPDDRNLRLLAASNLVNTVGMGLYLPASALFFTTYMRLPITHVGIGMSVAGAIALALTLPLGHLADRWGPRRVYTGMLLLQAVTMAVFPLASALPTFLAVLIAYNLAEAGAAPAKGALIAAVGRTPQERVEVRAYLRAVTNVGVALGTMLAGVALAADTDTAYLTLILGNAGTFLLAALPLPAMAIAKRGGGTSGDRQPLSMWSVLKDRRFLVAMAACSIVGIHSEILAFALPLWIVDRTSAPQWSVSMVIVIITAMVILLQVPLSKGASSLRGSARHSTYAGFALFVACLLLQLAPSLPQAALSLLAVYAVLHALGEIWQSSSLFGLSFGSAPPGAHGQYQAVAVLGRGLVRAVAPVVLTWSCLSWEGPGWVAIGGVLLVVGAATPFLVGRRRAGSMQAAAGDGEARSNETKVRL
ncbi:MFS transporter [Nocardiopsis rhodophaea]|uniref:MFS transporter n=1 Tax=Nocardiopsis rhodophaea TaxID=280238 RepID=UPI0031D6903C